METNSASAGVRIYVNGVATTSYARQSCQTFLTASMSDEIIMALNAGDVVTVRFFSNGGTVRCFDRSLTIIQLK